jgi:hypothetical protein
MNCQKKPVLDCRDDKSPNRQALTDLTTAAISDLRGAGAK